MNDAAAPNEQTSTDGDASNWGLKRDPLSRGFYVLIRIDCLNVVCVVDIPCSEHFEICGTQHNLMFGCILKERFDACIMPSIDLIALGFRNCSSV